MGVKKQTYTPEQRARKTARARERREELRAQGEGPRLRAMNAARARRGYAKKVSSPEGLGKVRAKRNATARRRSRRERAAKQEARGTQDAEQHRAEQHLEDTLEAYRLGVRNFRRFERQPGVTAARLESARKGVAELRREVLKAHAAVERVKAKHKRG